MRKVIVIGLVALLMGAGGVVGGGTASAATGDVGFQDQSYRGATNIPTSDKPQSKLWFAHGSWWADMFDTTSKTWHIFRLDRTTQNWVDTGVQIDDRVNSLADVLWDGTRLYVASHAVTVSSSSTASVSGSPARLYRYSYSAATGYTLDQGFPVAINDHSSESMTLAKDSTGTLWATWTQVSASAAGLTSAVYVNSTGGDDTRWGTPFVLPAAGSAVAPDDISTVVSFGKTRIGVMWSNQRDDSVYWAVHTDGSSRTKWKSSVALRGPGQADDHINVKAVQADASGRVFAVVKTSMDATNAPRPEDPEIRLLTFKPSTAAWSVTTVGTVADCHTRPLLVLDESRQTVHVFMTAPTDAGCPFSGAAGTIYGKTAPMDRPVFAAGRGAPVIRDVASPTMNDVTGSKQSATAASGIVVLASNKQTQRYWHADLSSTMTARVAPTAAFTAAVTSGQAPLPLQFTDTSTGSPTSWAWDFGDGTTATTQHPAHTYATAGTYTVTLTVTSSGGTSAPASRTITVSPAPPTVRGTVTAGVSTSAVGTSPAVDVSVPVPAGLAAGDVLVAQVTADNGPVMAAVPAGWTSVLTSSLSIGTGARLFAYYHVVSDPAAEPAAYGWTLSAAQKWGAGITAFRGVDARDPFEAAATTAVNSAAAAATLSVPGVTTTSDGAMLVGGVGLNNASTGVTPAPGWTEAWESTGGQVSELAHRPAAEAATGGAVTWSFTGGVTAGGWVRALRPAPVASTASFTSSVTGGQAPLPVRFTDTSSANPSAWAWDFGDGTTATTRNPAHTYAAPGAYTVTLKATNAGGVSAPATAQITVVAAPVAPTASFTSTVAGGVAPLSVQFTDTSTGSPTAWAWNFGNGATSSLQNPAHTYEAAGTYTVTLQATNATASSAPVTATVTVTAAAPTVGGQGIGATTEAKATSSTRGVAVTRPAGVADGDILVVRITTDKASSMKTVPTGWQAAPGNTSRVFTYYHVVTGAGAEPPGYTWVLSSPSKWTAIMTGFSGLDPRTPLTAVTWAGSIWPRV